MGLYFGAGADSFEGGASGDTLYGNAGEDTLIGAGGDDLLHGGSDNDSLEGDVGADTLYGGEGADTLSGGAGDDVLVAEGVSGEVLLGGAGNDTLAILQYEHAWIAGLSGIEAVRTNGFQIHGTADANLFDFGGLAVADAAGVVAYGFDGSDTLAGSIGHDMLDGGSLDDRVEGGAGNDTLRGQAGADTLRGGEGDDVLATDGDPGDVLDGGDGNDTLSIEQQVHLRIAALQGIEAVRTNGLALHGTAGDNFLDLRGLAVSDAGGVTLSGLAGADTLVGSLGNDRLDGGDADDLLEGDAGHDTLRGGAGVDTLRGGEGNDYLATLGNPGAVLDGGAGFDLVAIEQYLHERIAGLANFEAVKTNGYHLLGTAAANLFDLRGLAVEDAAGIRMLGEAGADTLVGTTGADSLQGGGDNDLLDGDAGNDTLFGQDGANTLLGGAGNDRLDGGGSADRLLGGQGADTLIGGGGGDTLDGGEGADRLFGSAASDIIVVDDPGDIISGGGGADTVLASLDHTLVAGLIGLALAGTAINGTGNGSANIILGNALDNLLNGVSGDDTLDGGAGDDSLLGALGADSLVGGEGADSLNGASGADTMAGGAGDDAYVLDDPLDAVAESGGSDTVFVSFTYALSAVLEHLTLTGAAAVNGTGNSLANALTGNNAANILAGGGGNDSLRGEGGADTLNGSAGADTMAGGAGADRYIVDNVLDLAVEQPGAGSDLVVASVSWTLGAEIESLTLTGTAPLTGIGNALVNRLSGNEGANLLQGLAGNDNLLGAGGADTLLGGEGRDMLTGGAGADWFRYASPDAELDRIVDFTPGLDRIVVEVAGFGGLASGALPGAQFVAQASYATTAPAGTAQFIYNTAAGVLAFDADGVGGADSIRMVAFTGLPLLGAADFLLV